MTEDRLRTIIESESTTLLNIFRHYALRAQLVDGMAVHELAQEILHEVYIEAMAHRDRFDEADVPIAWLIAVGSNLIKRRQDKLYKQERREPLTLDIYSETAEEEETLPYAASVLSPDPTEAIDSAETAEKWLGLVSAPDREILRHAILGELTSQELGNVLGVSAGTARVRLHRAIQRLKSAMRQEIV